METVRLRKLMPTPEHSGLYGHSGFGIAVPIDFESP
jgi:hypothetical protein